MSSGIRAPSDGALPLVTSDDVIARLDALCGAGVGNDEFLLAFDADGTLWSGDVGIDNFEALLGRGAVRPAALGMLRETASRSGLPLSDDATAQARILYEAYERDALAEESAFRVMACAFAGYRAAEVRQFAIEVAQASGLGVRLHPEVVPVLRWGAQRGIARYVVSASHATVVESCIDMLQLPIDGVFAMAQADENGVLAARLREPVTYGAGKTEALRAGARGKTLLGAFGDSAFDLHLLAGARLAVAVRPKPGLRSRAAECSGLVELAPASP
jgi:phosphoserine phosphatase